MIHPANHNQLRYAQGRVGNPGGRRFPAHIATDQFQVTSKVQSYSGRVFSLSPVLPTGPTCRGIRASAFYSIARWPLSSLSDRRLVLLLPVRAATYSSNVAHEVRRRPGASCRGAQFSLRFNGGSSHLCVPHNLARQSSYVPERHSSVPFVVRRLDDDEHSERLREPCSRNQRKRLPQ
jgi:hypothetical protein